MTTNTELLNELNTFRATENLAPFADWCKARHLPLLEAYRAAAAKAAKKATTERAAKLPTYKDVANYDKSTVESPVQYVHSFLDRNPEMTRKEAVTALQAKGVNFSTARTQYQRWFTKRKG